jgi:hypothetical protein
MGIGDWRLGAEDWGLGIGNIFQLLYFQVAQASVPCFEFQEAAESSSAMLYFF